MKKFLFSIILLAIASYGYSQCFTDRHNSSTDQSWLSCEKSVSPNSDRGNTHWIMYDFGDVYKLGQSTFWNINNPDELRSGIRDAYVDYSVDGINWTQWGTMHLEMADASGFYEGEEGPHFEDMEARYLLITVIDNYGNVACAGLSEIRIEHNGVSTATQDELLVDIKMSVNPNPASKIAFVQLSSEVISKGVLQLTDIGGKLIKSQPTEIVSGTNQLQFDITGIAAGQYLISYVSENRSHSVNLSVVHDN